MEKASLTQNDLKMLAYLDSVFGSRQQSEPPAVATPAAAARTRRGAGLLMRTVLLVGLAALLVMGTESGQTMYGAIFDQVPAIQAAWADLFR
jgi:hypothetical protein